MNQKKNTPLPRQEKIPWPKPLLQSKSSVPPKKLMLLIKLKCEGHPDLELSFFKKRNSVSKYFTKT